VKKLNYKKILRLFLWIFGLAGLLSSWSFASKKQGQTHVQQVSISITNPGENDFIDEFDVKSFFEERNDQIENSVVSKINLNDLEKALNTHPAVENAEISYEVTGELKIQVKQRRPMVRIINQNGESYYIDSTGRIMPLSYKSTSRVLVANGFLNEPFIRRNQFSMKEIASNESLSSVTLLDDIYEITNKIYADSCLSKLIHQIYVNEDQEFILIPVLGKQEIMVGRIDLLSEKLTKLKLFYNEGLNKTDSWNKYKSINLKYKNIVVCTKI
jgi:cell division protein FtsQ